LDRFEIYQNYTPTTVDYGNWRASTADRPNRHGHTHKKEFILYFLYDCFEIYQNYTPTAVAYGDWRASTADRPNRRGPRRLGITTVAHGG
jgi:hypothetical protein